ncbi:RNA helicase [Malassezia sp. CBS 17886]|nr:RNA helicase [Malassezia sp. CBS 17886]
MHHFPWAVRPTLAALHAVRLLRTAHASRVATAPASVSNATRFKPAQRHRLSNVVAERRGSAPRVGGGARTHPRGRAPSRGGDDRQRADRQRADAVRAGELPSLDFETPVLTVPPARADAFRTPPLSEGLLAMLHALLGAQARPTVPQAQALARLCGKDRPCRTLIAAETGSGKTLAYLLPVLQRLHETRTTTEKGDREHVHNGGAPQLMPRAVVLAPTHELARQIADVAKALCHHPEHKLRVACTSTPAFMTGLRRDLARLRDGDSDGAPPSPDVLVATPARLEELCTYGSHDGAEADPLSDAGTAPLSLRNVQSLVVDEADTMHDHSFMPATSAVTSRVLREAGTACAERAEVLFATATIPKSLSAYFAETFPDLDTLASPKLHHLPPKLTAMFVDPGGSKDLAILKQIFRVFTTPEHAGDKILIFRDKRTSVEQLSSYLRARNVDHVALTGDAETRRSRNDAELARFLSHPHARTDRAPGQGEESDGPRVLITTSLLSRGLDFAPEVRFVFLPDAGRHGSASAHAANNNALELLHRAGRSARAGRSGCVVLFDKRSAPGKSKVLINREGKKRGVIRGQMDLLVRELKYRKRGTPS